MAAALMFGPLLLSGTPRGAATVPIRQYAANRRILGHTSSTAFVVGCKRLRCAPTKAAAFVARAITKAASHQKEVDEAKTKARGAMEVSAEQLRLLGEDYETTLLNAMRHMLHGQLTLHSKGIETFTEAMNELPERIHGRSG